MSSVTRGNRFLLRDVNTLNLAEIKNERCCELFATASVYNLSLSPPLSPPLSPGTNDPVLGHF